MPIPIEIKEMVEAVKVNDQSLTEINFRYFDIGVEGIKALAEALESNRDVKILKFRRNYIGDEGIKIGANGVAQNNGINILNSRGKEEKISTLNDKLKHDKIFTHLEWEENRTYLTIGNYASHGDNDEYNMEQVENFYKHIQSLLNNFNI